MGQLGLQSQWDSQACNHNGIVRPAITKGQLGLQSQRGS